MKIFTPSPASTTWVSWELAHYHRNLDHFYLPWETDIAIPTQWIIPERTSYPGYLINVAELRGYRFFPEKNEVITYPIGIGVLDYKTPIGQHFRVQNKAVNPGWHIPKGLQAKYGMSYMPPGEDCPVGNRWMGLSHYGLHGTHAPMGVGRLVSHGCIRHYPEDIEKLFDMTPVGTTVELIYEPVKFGFLKGRIFVEVHQDIYFKIPDMLQVCHQEAPGPQSGRPHRLAQIPAGGGGAKRRPGGHQPAAAPGPEPTRAQPKSLRGGQ